MISSILIRQLFPFSKLSKTTHISLNKFLNKHDCQEKRTARTRMLDRPIETSDDIISKSHVKSNSSNLNHSKSQYNQNLSSNNKDNQLSSKKATFKNHPPHQFKPQQNSINQLSNSLSPLLIFLSLLSLPNELVIHLPDLYTKLVGKNRQQVHKQLLELIENNKLDDRLVVKIMAVVKSNGGIQWGIKLTEWLVRRLNDIIRSSGAQSTNSKPLPTLQNLSSKPKEIDNSTILKEPLIGLTLLLAHGYLQTFRTIQAPLIKLLPLMSSRQIQMVIVFAHKGKVGGRQWWEEVQKRSIVLWDQQETSNSNSTINNQSHNSKNTQQFIPPLTPTLFPILASLFRHLQYRPNYFISYFSSFTQEQLSSLLVGLNIMEIIQITLIVWGLGRKLGLRAVRSQINSNNINNIQDNNQFAISIFKICYNSLENNIHLKQYSQLRHFLLFLMQQAKITYSQSICRDNNNSTSKHNLSSKSQQYSQLIRLLTKSTNSQNIQLCLLCLGFPKYVNNNVLKSQMDDYRIELLSRRGYGSSQSGIINEQLLQDTNSNTDSHKPNLSQSQVWELYGCQMVVQQLLRLKLINSQQQAKYK